MEASPPLAAGSAEAPDLRPAAPVVVSICVSCRVGSGDEAARPGGRLLDVTRNALRSQAGVLVRSVECLGVCKRPVTAAVSAEDGFTFVFGDLDPESGPEAIAHFARDYARTDYGFVPWRERPPVLQRSLVARIPPPGWSPEDGKPPG